MQKYAYLYRGLVKSAKPVDINKLLNASKRDAAERNGKPNPNMTDEEFQQWLDWNYGAKHEKPTAVDTSDITGKSIYDTEDAIENSRLMPGEVGATLDAVPESVDMPVTDSAKTESERRAADRRRAKSQDALQHSIKPNTGAAQFVAHQQQADEENAGRLGAERLKGARPNSAAKETADAYARKADAAARAWAAPNNMSADEAAQAESRPNSGKASGMKTEDLAKHDRGPVTAEQRASAQKLLRHALGQDKWDSALTEQPLSQTPLSQKPGRKDVKDQGGNVGKSTDKPTDKSTDWRAKLDSWLQQGIKYAPQAAAGMAGFGGLYSILSMLPGAKRRRVFNLLASIVGGGALAYGADRYMKSRGSNGVLA